MLIYQNRDIQSNMLIYQNRDVQSNMLIYQNRDIQSNMLIYQNRDIRTQHANPCIKANGTCIPLFWCLPEDITPVPRHVAG
jgi:hypothetical protein